MGQVGKVTRAWAGLRDNLRENIFPIWSTDQPCNSAVSGGSTDICIIAVWGKTGWDGVRKSDYERELQILRNRCTSEVYIGSYHWRPEPLP